MVTNKELEKRVIALEDALGAVVEQDNTVAGVMAADDEAIGGGRQTPQDPVSPRKKILDKRLNGESDTVPGLYRELVDKNLNQEFGIHIKAAYDRPMTAVTILVPEEYTKLTKEDLDMDGADIRIKWFGNSAAPEEVEDWCKLVRTTFDEETRLRIDADRKSLVKPQ